MNKRRLHHTLVLGLTLSPFCASMALAQPAEHAVEGEKYFDVPAGALNRAIDVFAAEAGITLTMDATVLQGKTTPGLTGNYSIQGGLALLLSGHNVQIARNAPGHYTLEDTAQQPQNQTAGGVRALGAITVDGEAVSAETAYAGGQVAYGGRVGLLGDKDFMETPFSTISYTDSYIADRQAKDITEVIAATDPTVFSNGVTGAWSENYFIRGFSSSTSDVTFGGLIGMAPYYRTSPEMFERIEVLKGPSALLNGMPPGGSVGGAVNLVPKRAGDDPLASLTATYMSDSQFGGHVDLGQRFGAGKQFGVRFNGVYRDGEGSVNHQEKETQLASLGLDWRGQRARLSADLYSAVDRVDGPIRGINLAPGLDLPPPPEPDTLINPDWAFAETDDKAAILRGEFDLTDQTTVYAAFGKSQTNYKYNGAMRAQVVDSEGTLETTMGQLAFEIDKESAEIGLNTAFQTGSINHQLNFNATHYEHDQEDFGRRHVPGADWVTNLYAPTWGPAAEFVAPPIFRSALRLNSYGVADTLAFAEEQLQLTLGVRRQEVVSDTFDVSTGERTSRYNEGATTPAAALLYRVTDAISLYANYIEGLSQGATAPMSADNAGEVFAPYKSKQEEIGAKFDLGNFAHTVSLFQISRPNSHTDPVTNIFSFDGEQRNRGAEWSFFGSPLFGVRLMGGAAYIDAELTKTADEANQGNQATGVPKLQAKLGGEWDLPYVHGLTVTGNATAVSKQYINAENTLSVPGRTIYDLGARYVTNVSNLPLTLRANVANITNKAYWGMPQLFSLALGAPRTFTLSATVDF